MGVKTVELSKYSDNVATYAVRHNGTTDELAKTFDDNYGIRFEITGMKSGKIEMKMK